MMMMIMMAHHMNLISLLVSLLLVVAALLPLESNSHGIRRAHIRAFKKLAIVGSVLGNRKKVMIPLPVPLPLPIPIIHKHEPIISPIDPLLTITAAKGAKGYYQGFGQGVHGGLSGFGLGYGKRR